MNYEILFMTDDSKEYYMYRLLLEENGNSVSLRSNMKELYSYLLNHYPSIAILDFDIPQISDKNLSIVEFLYDQNIPMIIIVEDIDDDTLIEFMDDYDCVIMKKPISEDDLMEEINLILGNKYRRVYNG